MVVRSRGGQRLDLSELAPVFGAEGEFRPNVVAALIHAAWAVPTGASQSSLVDAGGSMTDEMTVGVVCDEDVRNQVHEITSNSRIFVRVPFPASRSSPGGRHQIRC